MPTRPDGSRTPGPRLPSEVRIGRVRLQVADLDRSLGFYRDVIGLRERSRDDGVARLSGAAGASGADRAPGDGRGGGEGGSADRSPVLLELVERPGVRAVPRTGLMGIYHFALLVPTRRELGRFVRHQARRGTRFGAADHAFSEALYLEDPDGITIEVYADRPRAEWVAGPDGGLPLVSDPLDAAGLMAAAGEAEWSGVPAGSVIGHMHFFVDDLAAAERFYVRGLGFEPTITIPSALFVAAGGYHHHVGLNTWRAGAPTATEGDARLVDWELVVPDDAALSAAAERLEAEGFAVEGGADGFVARDRWGIAVRCRPE